jgi:hypothetical protein
MGLAQQVAPACVRLPAHELRRLIRQRAGVRLVDVAAELGVTHVAVIWWETGKGTPRPRDRRSPRRHSPGRPEALRRRRVRGPG